MNFSHQNPKPSDIDKKNNSGDSESLKALRIDNNHGGSGATGNHRRKRKGIKMSRNRDLLSDMPDEILRRILSFLPTRQSARTSVLSRRWRHLWRYVPTLHFDIHDHPPVRGDAEIFVSGRKLVYVIDQFVTLRDTSSSLLRFHLRLHIHDCHLEDPISNWISYARSHGVRDMAVSISWLNPYPLGPPFYIFFDLPSVEALYLQNTYSIVSDKLPQQIALSKLKVLTLDSDVEPISDQYLTMLLSSCPALQELTLTRGNCNKAVEIRVPSLRRLSITYYDNCGNSCQVEITCPKLEYFHLSNWAHLKHFQGHMPSLLKASIHLYLWAEPVEYVQQIFVSLSGVTELTLHLTADKEEKNLLNQIIRCPIFHKMKHFTFKAYLKENYFKEALLDFLLLSPNLVSLALVDAPNGLDTKRYLTSIVEGCVQQERIPRVLDHLKTVSVRGICNRRTRRDVLKMLSMHVSEWDRMVVIS